MTDELSPGMGAMLQRIAAGVELDGRSWRSLNGVVARGLAVVEKSGRAQLTDKGRAALAELPSPEAAWIDAYRERHPERAPKRKAVTTE